MIIKKITPQDMLAMQKLLSDIEIFTDEEIAVVNELLDIYIKNPLQKDYQFFATLEDHYELSSFICFGPTPMTANTYDLYWIGTHSKYRQKGLAQKLIEVMREEMRRHGRKIIRVETSSQELYQGTLNFYLRLGFKEEARLKDFYRDNDDLIIFTARF